MPATLPDRARFVVIGGGVIGASIAYHLALAGEADVVVLERDRLTSGTTWHAAGLMTTFGSLSHTSTAMRLYSRDLYARLEAETGQSTGFRPVGLIESAADAERLEEYRRVAAFQSALGLEVHEISPAEMAQSFPFARTDDLLAGFWVPGDGRVNPVDLTMSLAKGARRRGVRIIEGVTVTDVRIERGVVRGVDTDHGSIECEQVVNAAGMWARQLAGRSSVVVPNQAAEHYYLITEPIDGVSSSLPVFEDPASHGYYREEGGGLMVGLFEPVAAPWRVDGIPERFSFGTLPPDWERMTPFLERAMARVPITQTAGIRTFFCGPESFTPDLAPVVGPAPGLRGYFVCAGLNSIGILSAGGLGRIVAHWLTTGHPDVDVTGFSADRFHEYHLTPTFRAERTAEVLGTVYAAHPPGFALASARGARRSPVHDRLVAAGAFFKDVSGWESPDWYTGPGATPSATASWSRAPWWEHWEAEHRAVRDGVGLLDMSFMAKFLVQGPDAGPMLSWLSTADVDGASGRITYTQWLSDRGTIEADLTITKLGPERFVVVASDTAHGHVRALLSDEIAFGRPPGAAPGTRWNATSTDVTGAYAMFALQGPRSREVLAAATHAAVDAEAVGFRDVVPVDLGLATGWVARITYVGELGYELYVPTEMALHAWDHVVAAGASAGVRLVGLKALGSLRLEKAYRDYGHDIDNADGLLEAGLGFTAALDKPGGFRGREMVLAALAHGIPVARLVQVLVTDPAAVLHHGELLLRDGEIVGDVRSGSYGWSLGGAVGLGMVGCDTGVTADWLAAGDWTVQIGTHRYAVQVALRPRYDPTGARISQ